MLRMNGKQICCKCKEKKHNSEFYERGNRFINCTSCRQGRESRKSELVMLLQKEREILKNC